MSAQESRTSESRTPAGGPMGRGPGRRRGPMGRGHGPMAMMRGEKPRDFRGTMRRLIQYLGAYRIPILIVMFFAVASTVFSIIGPKILGKATTELFNGVLAQLSGWPQSRSRPCRSVGPAPH